MEKQNNTIDPFLSLYDYLGHAAGQELGKAVSDASVMRGIKVITRQIDTPKYKGKILMYPKSFLVEYFSGKLKPVIAMELWA